MELSFDNLGLYFSLDQPNQTPLHMLKHIEYLDRLWSSTFLGSFSVVPTEEWPSGLSSSVDLGGDLYDSTWVERTNCGIHEGSLCEDLMV